jgi:hypothetical protein
VVAANSAADVGPPSWWNGDCDTGHYNAVAGLSAHRLGASYLGVPVCGPGRVAGGVDVMWARPGWGEYEFECTELAFRFMAQLYGVAAYDGNGVDVVRNYRTSYGGGLVQVTNGTAGVAPRPGDIVSYTYYGGGPGHVTVVESSNVDASGNGSVRMLSQNDSTDGWRTANVVGWRLQDFGPYSPYGWLHDPAGRGEGIATPGAPQAVSGQAANHQVTVAWTAPASTGTSPITAYVVTASPGGNTCSWVGGPLSCVVTGLTNETTYSFVVVAKNASGPGPPSGPSPPVAPTVFSDVPMSYPFYADIMWAYGAGITTGNVDGTYAPVSIVSRQAMAAFLYRLSGSPNGPSPPCTVAPFPDVQVGAAFCGEIAWLAGQNITTGYPDGGFHPLDGVARDAMAAFLYRFATPVGARTSLACAPSSFTDVGPGTPFCGEIRWLGGRGIASGYDDGTFRPANGVARDAMAAFLHRFPGNS